MNSISDKIPRRNPLHRVEFYGILRACLNHAEGGHSEYDDKRTTVNCEGGSSTASNVGRGRQTTSEIQTDTGILRVEHLENQTGVYRRVPRTATQHKSTEHTNRITEANLFGLPGNSMVSSYRLEAAGRPTIETLSPFAIIAYSQMTGGGHKLSCRKRDAP